MKKAKLDIWEDIPAWVDDKPDMPISTGQDAAVEKDEGGRKWAMNKLLLISAPIVLVILIIGVLIAYHASRNSPQTPTPVRQTAPEMSVRESERKAVTEVSGQDKASVLPEKTTILFFKDFMIDLKDARGNNHVLMCDVAFDLGEEQQQDPMEKTALMRSIIYKTAQMRSVIALRSVEERKKLKKDLAFAIDKILGEGSVKNVYFMNYFIM